MPQQKTAIITGSTSGIGLGIAEGFAKAGINLVINGIEAAADVEATRASLEKHGVKVVYDNANMMPRQNSAAWTSSSTTPVFSMWHRWTSSPRTSGTRSSPST